MIAPLASRVRHRHAGPKLVTRLDVSGMLLSGWSLASLRLFCSDRPDRGCTGRSKARPGSCFRGGPSFCLDAPESLVETIGIFLQLFGELIPIGGNQ
jgi:hypothetical protein